MTMNNPNNRNRESSSYMPWIIGAVVVVAALIGIVSYNGSGNNTASNDTTSSPTSTTGAGSATTGSGSGSANDANTRTPLPAGPRR